MLCLSSLLGVKENIQIVRFVFLLIGLFGMYVGHI